MVNVSCELTFGSYHDVDSSEIAYKIAASQAFQDAAKRAKPVILEPIMRLEIVAPEKYMGDINGSIAAKRGQVEGSEPLVSSSYSCEVPLSEMFGIPLSFVLISVRSAMMNSIVMRVVPGNIAFAIF
jgi:elongation factor G